MEFKNLFVKPHLTIDAALNKLEQASHKILFVVKEDTTLLGTVTDGDIRRAILKHVSLEKPIADIMNSTPVFLQGPVKREEALRFMKNHDVTHIPVLNNDHSILDIIVRGDFTKVERVNDTAVVLMAGGLGTRLMPLTKDCPKPLLPLGKKPILQTIIENFQARGFNNFYISLNYLGHQIEEYFQDGAEFDCNIQYLREDRRLGTAGALSLLPESVNTSFIVMNADLLTKLNFNNLLDFHRANNAALSVCVREYEFQVPYGIVKTEDTKILSLEEKPIYSFFVNAGIYIVEPGVLESVPKDVYFDMTDLIDILIKHNKNICSFPIKAYWRDIGRHEDYLAAEHEYEEIFE